ncbi:MAG: TolC family protein [Candidatus Omnitrophica bacterium]|nr:TolC family protein [Candidatus Omnitrophota bacterium]
MKGQTPRGLTLSDCYRMALKQSEEIALRAELITETEGRFLQALSGILPKISFSSTDKRQDGNGGSAFTRKSLPERKFTFSQPLFSGFKEFAAIGGSRSEKRLRQEEKARAEQLLMVDVSDAFHLLVQQREDIRALEGIRQTLRQRIQELQERERIGRSRASERVAVEAQLYRVEAEWEQVQTREQVVSQLLQFLTGLSAVGELKNPGASLPAPEPEESSLAKATARPDVKGAEMSLEIARQQLKVARAKFFPTVGSEGNYYVERSGAAKEVTWDASLKVDVPIFQGGNAVGAAQEAESGVRQAEIKLQRARRVAIQEIRDAHAEYEGALGRVRALTKALEATEESYQLEVEEYRRSLVSNLEVLSILQTLQDARRDLISALYEAHRLYWKLKVTAGNS